jgi:hypothetical protein
MQISDEALAESTRLYQQEFKKELSKEDALAAATRLLTLYETVLRQPPTPPTVTLPPC